MEKVKKFLNNQWVVNICAPLIVASITAISVSITQKVSLKDSIVMIFNFIKSILSFKVSILVIALFIVVVFVMRYIIISIKLKESVSQNYADWYYNFKTMNHKEWIFTWEYKMYSNCYEIENLRPICSCGCELVSKKSLKNMYFGTYKLVCPNCENIYNHPDYDTKVEVKHLIEYKIKTNTYIKDHCSI